VWVEGLRGANGRTGLAARFVVAQVATRAIVGVVQAAVIFAAGAALGAKVDTGASLAWLVPLVVLGQAAVGDLGRELLILGGWLLGSFTIASRTFRFTGRS
jgi:hypothetical protein